jgi:predicted metal-dependent hydrolase
MSVDIVFPASSVGDGKASMQRFIYGNEQIEYEIKERKSDINRLLIKVHPDCHVVVLAPKKANQDAIQIAVRKRSRWICSQLKQFEAQLEHVTPRYYMGGESHYYLGKQYLLKIIRPEESSEHLSRIKLLRGKLEIIILDEKDNPAQLVKSSLEHWYKLRAKDVFSRRLSAVLGEVIWVSKRPPIRILSMQNQWGSCSPNGRLTLNTNLVKAPRECIDYVILHELCHIAEHNHSPRFYRLMSEVMPNWEEVKECLDGMAEVLLNGS